MSMPTHRILLLLLLLSANYFSSASSLKVGIGVADVTGPAAEVPMMGYAETSQKTAGIHTRLFSRAFTFEDETGNLAAFVSVEAGMISQSLRFKVIELVRSSLGNAYSMKNVMLSATHTHSGPGGYHGYTIYAIATLGFMKGTYDVLAHGIAQSIIKAHSSMKPARLFYNEGIVPNSGINRSPTSYLLNPQSERDLYSDNVDRQMNLVKIVDATTNEPMGMMNWHAVHPTNINNTNGLISGDNKGLASQMFERWMDEGRYLPGNQRFVAAFSNANEGDVSPNTMGARCQDTGERCDILTSSCGGSSLKCVASGPGNDMYHSADIIADRQFRVAASLFNSASEEIKVDHINHAHQSVDMSNYHVTVNGKSVKTCPPAMGFSFAAGTTDGPGGFDFTQGDTSGNPFWNVVRNVISKPGADQVKCHHPKPILLNTGSMTFPTSWQPKIIETQILRIGNLVLVGLPGEFTTMAGRRLRRDVEATLARGGMTGAKVMLSGLSNLYSGYITTYEEYQAQRYESASTIFGPHTLSAYQSQFSKLAQAIASRSELKDELQPPNLYSKIKSYSFVTPVVFDSVGSGRKFGDVVLQPMISYLPRQTVKVNFRTGHPRNNMRIGGTYLLVQRKRQDGSWQDVCNDASAETRFHWIRTSSTLGRSEARMEWRLPSCVQSGTYRMRHFGHYKPVLIWQSIKAFSGTSREFKVENPGSGVAANEADLFNDKYACGCV